MNEAGVKNRFLAAAQALGVHSERKWGALRARYHEPHRAYHTMGHIAECLALREEFAKASGWEETPEAAALMTLAICYHDAVYDTHAKDNEQKSAEFFAEQLRLGERGKPAEAMILATRHVETPQSDAEKLIADADLSSLGAPWEVFWQNTANIRKEYSWVPEADFKQGRCGILRQFLGRAEKGQLYHLAWFQTKFGAQAVDNLKRSIMELG